MTQVKFGVRVPNSGPLASVVNLVRAAQAAEELGFDSLWVHDHVVWSSQMHRHHISSGSSDAVTDDQTADFYEAITSVAYLAAVTQTIDLGIACLVMPTRNPIYAAKQLATLDHLCDGRLIVGVGLGSKATESSSEFDVFGVPFSARARLTDEYVDVMKTIWREPLASYDGAYVQFKDAEMFPKPKQSPHPPIWVGGWTDHAARRTARVGDGWIPGWLSPSEMARGRELLLRTADEHGRDGNEIVIAVEKLASIATDRDSALDRAVRTVRASSKTYERDVDDVRFALDRHIFGSVDDVVRRVDEFVAAGVTHFELKLIYATIDELVDQMQLWAEQVMPRFRDGAR
jgi:probable F420-dependent oxidoreductase